MKTLNQYGTARILPAVAATRTGARAHTHTQALSFFLFFTSFMDEIQQLLSQATRTQALAWARARAGAGARARMCARTHIIDMIQQCLGHVTRNRSRESPQSLAWLQCLSSALHCIPLQKLHLLCGERASQA